MSASSRHGPALHVAVERYPIAGRFTIARGSRTEIVVVVVTLADGPNTGRGECVPYARYGETVEGVVATLEGLRAEVAAGLDRAALQRRLPAGAARNALDCAFWDLEAKRSGRRVWELAGLAAPQPVVTAYTLSLGTPEEMAAAATAARERPLLKVKLGGAGDAARIAAVRAAAPAATLVVDANEAWRPENWAENLAACAAAGVQLIEQPLPADADAALSSGLLGGAPAAPTAGRAAGIALCADESFHDSASFAALGARYAAINIKLDKTGGLTEALAVREEARRRGLAVMVGCMLGTSLAMAPALLLAADAAYVDLDGPLLLARDRAPGLRYEGSRVWPPEASLWG